MTGRTTRASAKAGLAFLGRLEQRINALSLRERAFMFVSAAGLLLATADQVVIANSLKAQAGWKSTQRQEESDLLQLRTELGKLSRRPPTRSSGPAEDTAAPNTPDTPDLQAELRAARAEHEAARAAAQPASAGAASVALPELLARALRQQPGLTLVQLSTRPRSMAKPGQTGEPATAWQNANLSVSGSFADLRAFVAQLESTLPGLRWGTLTLDTASGTPMMTLSLWLNEPAL